MSTVILVSNCLQCKTWQDKIHMSDTLLLDKPSLQLELFTDNLPKRPFCTDYKGSPLLIRQRKSAIKRRYIQANPPWLRFWLLFDMDCHNGAYAWHNAGLASPNFTTTNRENLHAHLGYALSVPVLTGDIARREPLRYMTAVEHAYREALGADPSFGGLITKNPLHKDWETWWGSEYAYELSELAAFVELARFIPKRGKNPEEIGLGRNCTLFDWLRLEVGYPEVREFKEDTRNFIIWQSHLYNRGLNRNGDFQYPMNSREVWHIARSIARYTWHKYQGVSYSDEEYSEIQAARGSKGGIAKGKAYMDKKEQAIALSIEGYSNKKIAEMLGVTAKTLTNWNVRKWKK